jgi:hypothetical protein
MALSRSALDELRRELAEVRHARDLLDARIQGLELILAAERGGGGVRNGEDPDVQGRGFRTAAAVRRNGVGRRREKGSFRRMVLDALQKAPGSKCADLARLIEDEGFRISGSTSLRNRISHEIYRLRRLGVVRRERGGLYVVTPTTADAEQAQAHRREFGESEPKPVPVAV